MLVVLQGRGLPSVPSSSSMPACGCCLFRPALSLVSAAGPWWVYRGRALFLRELIGEDEGGGLSLVALARGGH